MTETFITPEAKSLLRRLQSYLGLLGLLLLLLGAGRVAVEILGADLAKTFNPALFSVETLIIGSGFLLTGYLCLYAMAAIGACEPPALSAMRYSLAGLTVIFWITVIWAGLTGISYLIPALALALLVTGINLWFWWQANSRNLWQVFGEPITHSSGSYRAMLVMVVGVGIVLMIAIGIIYGILSNKLELPASAPEPGELLYTSAFDNFNDEWDLPKGRQSADIVDGELLLTEGSGFLDSAFYVRLDSRHFSDFDLRVRTRQAAGDNDNSYGVIFRWRDFDNYYRFEISGDGFYRLSKTQDGRTETITQWIPSDIVHTGAATNEIRVIAKDDQFMFYVNQELMRLCTKGENREPLVNPLTGECVSNKWQDSYQDDSFRQGKIGLTVGTTQTTDVTEPIVVGFDNLVLVGPQ